MLKLIWFKAILVATNRLKYYVLKKYSKFILFENAAFESNY